MKPLNGIGLALAICASASALAMPAASQAMDESGANSQLLSSRTLDEAMAQAHSALMDFIDSEGVILDYAADKPTPEDCSLGRPNAIGWWSPIENGPMFTGVYMYAACERAKRSGLAADRDLARRLAGGLMKCASVSDVPGFIARGVGTDGRCHYPLSSDDQVHPWFYGLLIYCKSGIPSKEEASAIAGKMLEVGDALQAASWSAPCDGDFKGQHRGGFEGAMYRDAIRYLFILRALYEVGGGETWLKRYRDALAQCPPQSKRTRAEICALGYGPDREIYKGFEGWCMWMYVAPQLSVASLAGMEDDPSLRKSYLDSLALNARNALLAIPSHEKFDNGNSLVFGEAHWRDVFTSWFPQKTQEDARRLSERDRYKPVCKRKDYEHAYACQPLAAAAIAAFSGDEDARSAVEKTLLHYDYSKLKLSRFLYAECAYYALKSQMGGGARCQSPSAEPARPAAAASTERLSPR